MKTIKITIRSSVVTYRKDKTIATDWPIGGYFEFTN